jgi:peptidoglycan-associated lipoprotein
MKTGVTMRLTLPLTIGASVIIAAVAACGGGQPEVAPGPDPDSIAREQARQDSIARERARADSIRRVQEEADRLERQRRADSLAAVRAENEAVMEMIARRMHFDFDRSNIRPGEDTEVVEQKLAILQANAGLRIEITGHCDERGTDEYNMALGMRRAVSAKQFLVDRGIDEARITVRSQGEEQPLAMGHNEDAWSQNRRDEFRVTAGGGSLKRPGM